MARELAMAGAPAGSVVTADTQMAGRGRQGRAWATLPNGASLAYSALLRTDSEQNSAAFAAGSQFGISPLLPLAVAIASCEALEALAPITAMIKWPNDIWIAGRKCAGILVEARPQDGWAVIGVGVNLAVPPTELPTDAAPRATSVGHGATPVGATMALNEALSNWVGRSDEEVVAGFETRDALKGSRISWADGAGIAGGIDARGNLIVNDDLGNRHALSAGEVHLSRR